jgi:predicted DNA-binding transcriptional regulator AlpA
MSALLSGVHIPDAPSSTHHDNETSPRWKTGDVCKYFQVGERTIHRWLANPALAFPRPTIVNGRKYWDRSEVIAWARSRRGVAA